MGIYIGPIINGYCKKKGKTVDTRNQNPQPKGEVGGTSNKQNYKLDVVLLGSHFFIYQFGYTTFVTKQPKRESSLCFFTFANWGLMIRRKISAVKNEGIQLLKLNKSPREDETSHTPLTKTTTNFMWFFRGALFLFTNRNTLRPSARRAKYNPFYFYIYGVDFVDYWRFEKNKAKPVLWKTKETSQGKKTNAP